MHDLAFEIIYTNSILCMQVSLCLARDPDHDRGTADRNEETDDLKLHASIYLPT
jgi:hypothetical protein